MKFVDLDKEICDLVKQEIPELEVINDSLDNIEGDIISTCSNPIFSMGGGLDRYLDKRFNLRKIGQSELKEGLMIIGDDKIKRIYLNITVYEDITTDSKLITRAYELYLQRCKKCGYKDIILTAFGTGIGGFDKKEMVKILKDVLSN